MIYKCLNQIDVCDNYNGVFLSHLSQLKTNTNHFHERKSDYFFLFSYSYNLNWHSWKQAEKKALEYLFCLFFFHLSILRHESLLFITLSHSD